MLDLSQIEHAGPVGASIVDKHAALVSFLAAWATLQTAAEADPDAPTWTVASQIDPRLAKGSGAAKARKEIMGFPERYVVALPVGGGGSGQRTEAYDPTAPGDRFRIELAFGLGKVPAAPDFDLSLGELHPRFHALLTAPYLPEVVGTAPPGLLTCLERQAEINTALGEVVGLGTPADVSYGLDTRADGNAPAYALTLFLTLE